MAAHPWHYHRPEFASHVLSFFAVVPTLTLYSPRRTGKTVFVLNDLAPAANQAGHVPIYVDLWANQDDTGAALVHALRRAHTELTVPRSSVGKTLKQPVERMQIFGLGLSLGELPVPTEPEDRIARITYWFDKVLEATDRQILLIVDEVQQLAVDPKGQVVAAALRSNLQIRSDRLWAFFTGSSQHNLARMFDDASTPFYQYGQQLRLPDLDRDFTDHIADRFEQSSVGRCLDRDALYDAFLALDRRPGPLLDMATRMLIHASTNVAESLQEQEGEERRRAEQMLVARDFDRRVFAVAARIAHGLPYSSVEARQFYARLEGLKQPLKPSQVTRALDLLINAGIVDKGPGRGEARLCLTVVADVLREQFPDVGSA